METHPPSSLSATVFSTTKCQTSLSIYRLLTWYNVIWCVLDYSLALLCNVTSSVCKAIVTQYMLTPHGCLVITVSYYYYKMVTQHCRIILVTACPLYPVVIFM